MRHPLWLNLGSLSLVLTLGAALRADDPLPGIVLAEFRPQQIEEGLTVGYAVQLFDVNEDDKLDILVVDSKRVVWYENPSWERHTMLDGQTKPDNVCAVPIDVDRDGHLDVVLGADWNPSNTQSGGSLDWLKRPDNPTEPWTLHPIGEEPTVHRVRAADLEGDGTPEVILAPLQGRLSSRQGNFRDGRPVRILAFPLPQDPVDGPWEPTVLSEELFVVHNIWPVPAQGREGHDLLAASYEGVSLIRKTNAGWETVRIGTGNQDNPDGSLGASEVKMGKLADGSPFIATIEPWHGHQVVVYTPGKSENDLWNRHVLDDQLKWGHAVWCADLDGEPGDELIIGVRDDLSEEPGQRRGIRLYKPLDASRGAWARQIIEAGGVAVEDLAAADLDGDGNTDIVAVGRQTGNARIYWNLGK